jgi:hypothetical protein
MKQNKQKHLETEHAECVGKMPEFLHIYLNELNKKKTVT